jgi:hypothetical protein
MNYLMLFAVQIGLPLLLGLAVTYYLRDATRTLLSEICGSDQRAEFWVRVIAVLTAAPPLILVLFCGDTLNGVDGSPEAAYLVLRQTLWLSLAGVVGAVGVLARSIWKQIPQALAVTATHANFLEGEPSCGS